MSYNAFIMVKQLARDGHENDVEIVSGWALDPYKNHTEADAEAAGTTILNRVSGGAGVFVRKASSGDVVTTFVSPQILVSCLVSVTIKRD